MVAIGAKSIVETDIVCTEFDAFSRRFAIQTIVCRRTTQI